MEGGGNVNIFDSIKHDWKRHVGPRVCDSRRGCQIVIFANERVSQLRLIYIQNFWFSRSCKIVYQRRLSYDF